MQFSWIRISRTSLIKSAEALRSIGDFDEEERAEAAELERLADALAGLSWWRRLALKLAGVLIETGGEAG